MWRDIYLKAQTEGQLRDAFPAGWFGEDNELRMQDAGFALDVVGLLDGAAGWHVNLRLREGMLLPETLAGFVMSPPHYPKRAFA